MNKCIIITSIFCISFAESKSGFPAGPALETYIVGDPPKQINLQSLFSSIADFEDCWTAEVQMIDYAPFNDWGLISIEDGSIEVHTDQMSSQGDYRM